MGNVLLLCMYPNTLHNVTFDKVVSSNNLMNLEPPCAELSRKKKLWIDFDSSYIDSDFYSSIDYESLTKYYCMRPLPMYWYRRNVSSCFSVIGAWSECDILYHALEQRAYDSHNGALSLDYNALPDLHATTIEFDKDHRVMSQDSLTFSDNGIKMIRGAAALGIRMRYETGRVKFGCVLTKKVAIGT